MKKGIIILMIVAIVMGGIMLSSCGKEEAKYDAAGSFEAVETVISSEATGRILSLSIEEGDELKAGDVIGYVDSIGVNLMKQQMHAQTQAILSNKPDISKQVAIFEQQLQNLENEKARITRLVAAEAATKKMLDEVNYQIDVLKKQIEATNSTLERTTNSITMQTTPINVQIKQIQNQLSKYTLINPIDGVVLTKYAEVNEVTTVGKPLYKIANLSEMKLKAYVSANQLSEMKLGQQVKVRIYNGEESYKEYSGVIEKIANQAEFTPKTIQTKNERQNLVYAIKINVKNDGYLKIGMYGEVYFK